MNGGSLFNIWVHYDSRVSHADGALGRGRLLCGLGGKFPPPVDEFGRPENLGRRVSQFDTAIGSASKKAKRAGKESGV